MDTKLVVSCLGERKLQIGRILLVQTTSIWTMVTIVVCNLLVVCFFLRCELRIPVIWQIIMNCQTNLSILIWYLESIKNMLFSLSFIACTHLGLGVRFKTCFKAMHYVLHAYSFKRSVSCPILCKWLAIWKQIHLWWPW